MLLARYRAFCTERIPVSVRRGYFSFFALLNFLSACLPSHYNWIDGAKGKVSLVTPRPVRAARMLFENCKTRADRTVQP